MFEKKSADHKNYLNQEIHMAKNIYHNNGTVLPAKSDSDVMFCLQSDQGVRIDRSLVICRFTLAQVKCTC